MENFETNSKKMEVKDNKIEKEKNELTSDELLSIVGGQAMSRTEELKNIDIVNNIVKQYI